MFRKGYAGLLARELVAARSHKGRRPAPARALSGRARAQGPAARMPVKLLGNLRAKCPRSVPVRLLLGHALAGSAPARPSAHTRPFAHGLGPRLYSARAAGRCSTAQEESPVPSAR